MYERTTNFLNRKVIKGCVFFMFFLLNVQHILAQNVKTVYIPNNIIAEKNRTIEKNGDKLFAPGKFKLNRLTPKVKLTGTCFPGDRKIFVGTNGDMHLCEAIAESLPIGNVSKGFYFDQIRKIVREFNEEIIKKKCWLCDIWTVWRLSHIYYSINKITKTCKHYGIGVYINEVA